MKCPSCNTDVADDAAICPSCDHILDPSLFSDEPPAEPKPRAGAKKPVKRPSTGPAGAKKAAPKKEAPKRMMPDAPGRKARTPPEQRAPVEDWHEAPRPRVDPASMRGGPSQALDPEEAMSDARTFLVSLTFSDKLAFWGGVATLFACFLPWKETAVDGESIGLLSLGALVFVANIALLGVVVIRTRKLMPKLHALVPWLVQFGAASFSIVWCLILIKLSVNTLKARALYGNEEVWTSKPGLGVILAVLTSIVALGGTLMGLREKPD